MRIDLDHPAQAGPVDRLRRLADDAMHGGFNAVAGLAVMLSIALLAYMPLHDRNGAELAIAAAFATVIGGGCIYALMGRTASPVGSLSSATALIVAALIARLLHDPAVDLQRAGSVPAVLACAAASVFLMGLLQVVGGLLGAGTVSRYVPQGVLAGFKNGVAVLILIAQLPPLLGLPALANLLQGDGLALVRPAAAALGLATAGVIGWVTWARPRAPAALIGLLAGAALAAMARWGWPDLSFGPRLGDLQGRLPWPDALVPLLAEPTRALLLRHAADVLQTAAALAVVGTLESALTAVTIDRSTHTRHHAGRELMALGAGNMASGLCGGLPLVLSRMRSMLLIQHHALGRRPVLASVVVYVVLFAISAPLLQWLPRPVLAGIMLTIAVALVDDWTWQLLRRWWHGLGQRGAARNSASLKLSLTLVATVCIVTVWLGFIAAVLVGMLLSVLSFMVGMNRSLVRNRGSGADTPSRRLYAPGQEAVLQPARARVLVLQLEGALFFGSAERLLEAVDRLPDGCRAVVLDFKRIGSIDESGAITLQSLAQRLQRQGVRLLLAGIVLVEPVNALGRSLLTYRCFDGVSNERLAQDCHPDLDRAVEAIETQLLAEAGSVPAAPAMPLADAPLLAGLSAAQRDAVIARMPAVPLAAGALLFRQGDAADRLYVLTVGSVSIIRRDTVPTQRFASFPPGMVFGETAMLDGAGRSADASADADSVVHELTAADLQALQAADPSLAATLWLNIARHLSQRLRRAASP